MKKSLAPHQSPQNEPAKTQAAEAFTRIRAILQQARSQALVAVNAAMVRAYWEVGREIVEEEQRGQERAGYGQRLLEELATRLTVEFGKGFDASNLRNMRQFYAAFPNCDALRHELSWTHYRLLSRIEKPEVRAFYEVEAVKSRWSTRELERQITSLLYERLSLSRDKEGVRALAEQGAEAFTPADLIRDSYVLEFTGLPEQGTWQESDLEQALIDRLQHFLLELGRDFFFVARAYYRNSTDHIQMPNFENFREAIAYYSVLAHETTHWTGAKQRLDRDLKGRFGNEAYAAEELVAELGAAFLCADLSLTNEPRPDHAAYVANWLQVLKNDNRAIFTAAAKAQQAVDYVHSLQVHAAPDLETVPVLPAGQLGLNF